MSRPRIVINRRDAERLEALLDAAGDGGALLAEELGRADVVEPLEVPADVITMNSRARVRILGEAGDGGGREIDVELVYPRDADGAGRRVSVLAPVGSALLGLREGDVIAWPMPGGRTERVQVVEVTHQPERTGDFVS